MPNRSWVCPSRGVERFPEAQNPFTENGPELPEALPVLAINAKLNPPRSIDKFENVACPAALVTAVNAPLSVATEHGSGVLKMPLRLIATVVPGIGALLASVTCTTTGPPLRICPPTEFCRWLTKVTFAGTALPAGAIVTT